MLGQSARTLSKRVYSGIEQWCVCVRLCVCVWKICTSKFNELSTFHLIALPPMKKILCDKPLQGRSCLMRGLWYYWCLWPEANTERTVLVMTMEAVLEPCTGDPIVRT